MKPTRPVTLLLFALAGTPAFLGANATAFADGAHADPKAPKANGDSSSDTAPLAAGKSDPAPLDSVNFPPPGGATNGAGPNPRETGPIDASKAQK